MCTIFQGACGCMYRHKITLLSCERSSTLGAKYGPPLTQHMFGCLNGPGPGREWVIHNGEQRPSRCYKRGGGRESSRQQGQHDTKSIICFGANKPATVCLRLTNLQEEKTKGWAKLLLPVWAWLPLSALLLFPFPLKSNRKRGIK